MKKLLMIVCILSISKFVFAETYYVCEFLKEDVDGKKAKTLISSYTVTDLNEVSKEDKRNKKIVTVEKYTEIVAKYNTDATEEFNYDEIESDLFVE